MKRIGFISAITTLLSGCAETTNIPWNRSVEEPCDNKAHCVSTLEQREAFHLEPFILTTEGQNNWQKIIQLAQTLPGATLVESDDNYFHIEVTSSVFKFIDDFEVQRQDQQLIVRSISRTGYSDFGVNRKRAQQFRTLLVKHQLLLPSSISTIP